MPLDDPPGVAVTANQHGHPEPGTAPWSDRHRWNGNTNWQHSTSSPYELMNHPDFQNLISAGPGQSRFQQPHCWFQTLLHHQHLRPRMTGHPLSPSLVSGDEPAGLQSYSSDQPCTAEHRPQGRMDRTRDVESFDVCVDC